jgi:tRNA 2-thiouridine synthesizing protein A
VLERWDAGDIGCGKLVFELRSRMDRLKPGDRLEVVARDPGARVDLPAWCRMTGNTLVSEEHPVYLIERKAG